MYSLWLMIILILLFYSLSFLEIAFIVIVEKQWTTTATLVYIYYIGEQILYNILMKITDQLKCNQEKLFEMHMAR
jgi:hypothetical protein